MPEGKFTGYLYLILESGGWNIVSDAGLIFFMTLLPALQILRFV